MPSFSINEEESAFFDSEPFLRASLSVFAHSLSRPIAWPEGFIYALISQFSSYKVKEIAAT